ncbi:hypothetical protein Trydic_g23689 [Trypoxylus dichotomus]
MSQGSPGARYGTDINRYGIDMELVWNSYGTDMEQNDSEQRCYRRPFRIESTSGLIPEKRANQYAAIEVHIQSTALVERNNMLRSDWDTPVHSS